MMHKFKLEEKYDKGRVIAEVNLTDSDLAKANSASIKAALLDKLCDRWDLEVIKARRRTTKRTKG